MKETNLHNLDSGIDVSAGINELVQNPPKICTCCRVSKAKSYFYYSTKIAKARPEFDDRSEYPSVQINSSIPCLKNRVLG